MLKLSYVPSYHLYRCKVISIFYLEYGPKCYVYIHQEKIKITPIAHLSIPSVILLINKLNHITHLMKKNLAVVSNVYIIDPMLSSYSFFYVPLPLETPQQEVDNTNSRSILSYLNLCLFLPTWAMQLCSSSKAQNRYYLQLMSPTKTPTVNALCVQNTKQSY